VATVIGLVVLAQRPTAVEAAGVGLVIGGVALHQPPTAAQRSSGVASSTDVRADL
jgi:drug/metabolite transporter (DMT)-like permease